MAKKPPPPGFNDVVCERLRQLANWRNKAVTEKQGCIEERDEMEEEIKGEEKGDNKTRIEGLKARHSDAVRKIKYWSKILKAADSKIITTIQKGDQSELFDVERITEKTLFEGDDTADDGEEADKELAGAGA